MNKGEHEWHEFLQRHCRCWTEGYHAIHGLRSYGTNNSRSDRNVKDQLNIMADVRQRNVVRYTEEWQIVEVLGTVAR
jgi:hypothetical protein